MGNNRQKRKKTQVKHNHNILYFTKGGRKIKKQTVKFKQKTADTRH